MIRAEQRIKIAEVAEDAEEVAEEVAEDVAEDTAEEAAGVALRKQPRSLRLEGQQSHCLNSYEGQV